MCVCVSSELEVFYVKNKEVCLEEGNSQVDRIHHSQMEGFNLVSLHLLSSAQMAKISSCVLLGACACD